MPSSTHRSMFSAFWPGPRLYPVTLHPKRFAMACEPPPWPEPRSSTCMSGLMVLAQSIWVIIHSVVYAEDSLTPSSGFL